MANPNFNPDMKHLSQVAELIFEQGVSKNTHKSYNLAMSKLFDFKILYKLNQVWPVSVNDLLHFMAYLSVQSLSGNTISSYISGISYYQIIQGMQDTTIFFKY